MEGDVGLELLDIVRPMFPSKAMEHMKVKEQMEQQTREKRSDDYCS